MDQNQVDLQEDILRKPLEHRLNNGRQDYKIGIVCEYDGVLVAGGGGGGGERKKEIKVKEYGGCTSYNYVK
jgi:hypothetical protein